MEKEKGGKTDRVHFYKVHNDRLTKEKVKKKMRWGGIIGVRASSGKTEDECDGGNKQG